MPLVWKLEVNMKSNKCRWIMIKCFIMWWSLQKSKENLQNWIDIYNIGNIWNIGHVGHMGHIVCMGQMSWYI